MLILLPSRAAGPAVQAECMAACVCLPSLQRAAAVGGQGLWKGWGECPSFLQSPRAGISVQRRRLQRKPGVFLGLQSLAEKLEQKVRKDLDEWPEELSSCRVPSGPQSRPASLPALPSCRRPRLLARGPGLGTLWLAFQTRPPPASVNEVVLEHGQACPFSTAAGAGPSRRG